CIDQRYVVAIMGFLAIANAYTMRVCLSVAITEMVVHHERNYTAIDLEACPSSVEMGSTAKFQHEGTFDWDENTQD
ncbi:hypothetical protein L9F63_012223, partial [Diploptera punctata]